MNPNTHPATWKSEELLSQCSFRSLRRSGPGGQHRNKVETAVILTHEPTGVKAEANEKRSQGANREVALKRLRINLAIDHRVPPQPFSSLWQVRVQRGRIMINHEHDDFPALLAELLDHWQPVKPELGELANELQTSASQLVKFLKLEPRAFALINQSRVEQGKRPLL